LNDPWGQTMLGPALTQLLGRLSVIPDKERTPEQTALYKELALLFAAVPNHPGPAHAKLDSQLRVKLRDDIHLSAITGPYDPPAEPIIVRCNTCGQAFPIMTQPKSPTGSET
jgi:hypothetical protein